MKRIIYLFWGVVLWGMTSCYDDKGSYDYHAINELEFENVKDLYEVLVNVDTLKIDPVIKMTDADYKDAERFQYVWVFTSGLNVKDTISRERVLNYPVTLEPKEYILYLKVKDLKTGVQWKKKTTVKVGTAYSKGIMLIGEDENGYADAQMISMGGIDTVIYKNLLKNSGLPQLTGPISFFHTGAIGEKYRQIWVFTESGSYYLNRMTYQGSPADVFENMLTIKYDEPIVPIAFAPELAGPNGNTADNGGNRAFVSSNGYLFFGHSLINGNFYAFPVNCLKENLDKCYSCSKYLFYSLNSLSNLVWFSEENGQFYKVGMGANYSDPITQKVSDLFNWAPGGEEKGRKLIYGENTWNEVGKDGRTYSFALMKVNGRAYIYKFDPYNMNATSSYQVLANVSDELLSADFYAFSSERTLLFYVKDKMLYAYNYDPGYEKRESISLGTTDEVTMIKFDLTVGKGKPVPLFIATYNSKDGGVLQRYSVGNDPDKVELKADPTAVWKGLTKVKNMCWRAIL